MRVFTDEFVIKVSEFRYSVDASDSCIVIGTTIMTILGVIALAFFPVLGVYIDNWLTAKWGYEAAHISLIWLALNLIEPAIQFGLFLLWIGIAMKFFLVLIPQFARDVVKRRNLIIKSGG